MFNFDKIQLLIFPCMDLGFAVKTEYSYLVLDSEGYLIFSF